MGRRVCAVLIVQRRYISVGFIKRVPTSDIISDHCQKSSSLSCMQRAGNNFSYIHESLQKVLWTSLQGSVFTFSFLLRLYLCLTSSNLLLCSVTTVSKQGSIKGHAIEENGYGRRPSAELGKIVSVLRSTAGQCGLGMPYSWPAGT